MLERTIRLLRASHTVFTPLPRRQTTPLSSTSDTQLKQQYREGSRAPALTGLLILKYWLGKLRPPDPL